ncbi:MAG: hypothetical protein IPM48_02675 [Saprospiraceae bacterium]|nr:hypothetical protein [Saprospiraceae bacterium]
MKEFIANLKKKETKVNISIVLNTHRTKPDNLQDRILLKNLIKEAEERLHRDYDKALASRLSDQLHKCAESIDHDYNKEGLILHVNENIAEYHRIGIPVQNRVIIDPSFSSRDLIRAKQLALDYFVLVLSKQTAKLYFVHSEDGIQELTGDFPIVNHHVPADPLIQSTNKGQDNLVEEFFNQVDKKLHKYFTESKHSVLLLTESRNYDHYLKIADHKNRLAGYVHGNFENTSAHQILNASQEYMTQKTLDAFEEKMNDLAKAQKAGKVVSDTAEIWRAIKEGKGQTLFVQSDLILPAVVMDHQIVLVQKAHSTEKFSTDDLIDEMIEHNILQGGEVVFANNGSLDAYQGLALSVRY